MSDLRVNSGRVSGVSAYGGDPAGTSGVGSTDGVGASLLPEPGLAHFADSGDVATMLAVLMTKSAREDRDLARKDERAAAEAAWQQGEAKVRDLHDKADHIRAEGWTEGLTTMAAGACDIASGVQGLDKAGDRASALWHGAGEAFSGAGKIGAGAYRAEQTLDDARAEHDGNAKDRSEQVEKSSHESVQDARDFLKKIVDWYSEMKKAKASTLQNAIFRA